MNCKFEFRFYRRLFRQPLRTHHGLWNIREGIIVKLTDLNGRLGWGEIAPLKAFGSESVRQSLRFCRQLPSTISWATINSIPADLSACRFGLESAWEMVSSERPKLVLTKLPDTSQLLPSGIAALKTLQTFQRQTQQTFKWKIGIAPLRQELELFGKLIQALPVGSRLRLDANGGLNWNEACRWLKICDDSDVVEFFEQPLPPDQFEVMLKLADQYATPIALDESVATLDQLNTCYQNGWRGIFVIKAAIAGSPKRLRDFCHRYQPDVVFSSVFETAIARHFIQTRLIPSLAPSSRAMGFGIEHWFADSTLDQPDFEQLWLSL